MEAVMAACANRWAMMGATMVAVFVAGTMPRVVQAQAPASAPVAMPEETVNLTMEQKHVIKEIIIKDMKTPAAPDAAQVDAKPGDASPQGVALQPMPVEVAAKVPQVRTHSYFVAGDKVVIVDPKDHKVSTVVE
jgi:hypothetical protein